MRIFNKIELFNAERNLLRRYNKDTEIRMLEEELQEYKDANNDFDEIDALCDIIVVAVGSMLKKGYSPTRAMEETCKEILSRKGNIGKDGKWYKDKSVIGYKADYSVALR